MSLSDIIKIKRKIEPELLKRNNIRGLGVGRKIVDGRETDEHSIRIYVNEKQDNIPDKEKIPSKIDGISTDVIERPESIQPQNQISGGFGIGRTTHGIGGTLGAIVVDVMGKPFALTCWHVLPNYGEEVSVRLNTGNDVVIGNVFSTALTGTMDASLSTINDAIKYNCHSPFGPINGTGGEERIQWIYLNKIPVKKYGITTSATSGFIDDIDESGPFRYSDIGDKMLYQQIQIKPVNAGIFSDNGDSGAIVLDNDNIVVGMIAGGTGTFSYANRIEQIKAGLGIDFC